MPSTQIRRLRLVDFRQFKDTTLDFTHPVTGRALNRVCLIGRNGTGKSTILQLMNSVLAGIDEAQPYAPSWAIEFENDGKTMAKVSGLPAPTVGTKEYNIFVSPTDQLDIRSLGTTVGENGQRVISTDVLVRIEQTESLRLKARSDLVVLINAESRDNQGIKLHSVPATSLDNALRFNKQFGVQHNISDAYITQMWELLVYLVKKRDSDREQFENRPENLQKTKAQLIEEFNRLHPPILEKLANLWDRLLAPAGLEFDIANAKIPIQLNENLEVFIRRKGSKQRVNYAELSSGMRKFLFRVGHLFLLFFEAKHDRSFVFIDEPEDSLFPDFLFEVMDVYDEIVGSNTQMFIATHNPIVAAQFEPYERVILDWDDDGFVTTKRGVAPKGDDPNDVLYQDFELSELMGRVGQEKWKQYLNLRTQIRAETDENLKNKLIDEASAIANAYNFGATKP